MRYFFETTSPLSHPTVDNPLQTIPPLTMEPYNPLERVNPYYLPWALRGILEDRQVQELFGAELDELLPPRPSSAAAAAAIAETPNPDRERPDAVRPTPPDKLLRLDSEILLPVREPSSSAAYPPKDRLDLTVPLRVGDPRPPGRGIRPLSSASAASTSVIQS